MKIIGTTVYPCSRPSFAWLSFWSPVKWVKAQFSNRLEIDDGQSLQREAKPCLTSPEKIARQMLSISGLPAKFHDLQRALLISADSVLEAGKQRSRSHLLWIVNPEAQQVGSRSIAA
ncbi:hypothetical protein PMIT1303_01602 [Prochlorococcus sp. MIT 1303]|nr:hypothetical protein PMIT1303_01602 [Prochlorococcus sp. MIT 1303]